MDNRALASRLYAMAHQRELGGASLYRIRAYRRAAEVILGLDAPVADLWLREGAKGLAALPHVGAHLAKRIADLIREETQANTPCVPALHVSNATRANGTQKL